ncbi:Peptidase S10, serine carboxypeptidase [Dillenia turbinata]|uniref:Carboxypeptidase n=1 Tax=Dillenia turbinata TaxID=194707 RepID=A0AAN8WAS0_9MAGN
MQKIAAFLLAFLSLSLFGFARDIPANNDHQIHSLPGLSVTLNFTQYSGYVPLSPTKSLFYWFIESPTSSGEKPLILWLNGGPGASSVALGLFHEVGPFHVNTDGSTLTLSPYAWNNEANILYLESPAGIGFSYSDLTEVIDEDSKLSDSAAAEDAYQFLIHWFNRYPQYKGRKFYMAGESYAGHYIPQLSQLIVARNKGISNPDINLQGFLLGNPALDDVLDHKGQFEFWWNLGLISDSLYSALKTTCLNHSYIRPTLECKALWDKGRTEMDFTDTYQVSVTPCQEDTLKWKSLDDSRRKQLEHCQHYFAAMYLNREDVRKAIHAEAFGTRQWKAYRHEMRLVWESVPSTLPIIKELIAAGLKMWIYSGNNDGIIPPTSTRYSLGSLNLKQKGDWHAWHVTHSTVGGWCQEYEGLTFAVVNGAGHEVPVLRHEASYAMLKRFLNNQPLD